MQIASVWIEEGCITCNACEEECPEVFEVTDDSCFIKADVRADGGFDENVGKAPLKSEFAGELADAIVAAAEACPVEVIIVVEAGAADGEAEETESTEDAAEEEAPSVEADHVATVDAGEDGEIEAFLSSGDRFLNILFGSQSGNAEGLAAKIAKQASSVGLEGVVHDMDGFDLPSLAGMSRVLICCSTWGEGEMPDNAEELWQQANAEGAPSLPNTHFSVCALGDTSYEFYCQSGIDWDERFEALGATRLVDRQDCDVDFDSPAAEWTSAALVEMAAVDGSGTYRPDMVEAIEAHLSGDSDVGADGEDGFKIPTISLPEIAISVKVFRYDPASGESGHDTWACSISGDRSILDLLRTLKANEDASLTFRDGSIDDPSTGIAVNGRLVLPGRTRITDIVTEREECMTLRIEPLPGSEVLRDLAIDHTQCDHVLPSCEPWFVGSTREGAARAQGPIGTMDPAVATALHASSDIESGSLLDAMSDTTPFNDSYIGPASVVHLWKRACDPRTSSNSRARILASLSAEGGVKAECDISAISRHRGMGERAAGSVLEAKTAILKEGSFRDGRHGNHVRWFTFTVKTSGALNETLLAGLTLGPTGMLANARSGIITRMALGFTRTGGPLMRDKQALLLGAGVPASVGKMPKLVNRPIEGHEEIVAIYNALGTGV